MSVLLLFLSVLLPSGLLGGAIAYRLGFRNLVVLVSVGGGLAMVAYVLALNSLSYVVPIQTSFWAAGLLLFPLAVGLLLTERLKTDGSLSKGVGRPPPPSFHLRLPAAPSQATMIMGTVTAVYGLFFGIIILATPGYDDWNQWSFISPIAHGNFPVRLPQNPDFYIQYHYGFSLVAAGMQHLGNIEPWVASSLVTTAAVILSAALAAALGYVAWNSLRLAILLPTLLFFSGGLLYLDVFRDLAPSPFIWGYAHQVVDRLFSQEPFHTGYFHGNMTETFGVFLHSRPFAFAMPFFLLFLLLAYVQFRQPRLTTAVLIGAVLAALALALEHIFVIAGASYAIHRGSVHLLRWRRQGASAIRREVAYDAVALSVAGVLAAVQGGVITDALLHRGEADASGTGLSLRCDIGFPSFASITGLSLRCEDIGFPSFVGFWRIGQDGWWQTVVKEFGLPLLLFPAYVFVALRRPHPVTTLLLIISTTSFLTPLFTRYAAGDKELVRFFALSQVSNGLLMAITLGYFLSAARYALAPAALLVGLVAFSPFMFNARLLPDRPVIFDLAHAYPDWPSREETKVATAAQRLVPERARVLTATPDRVKILWGRLAPHAGRAYPFSPSETWQQALQRPELSLLRKLKVDYVYCSPAWQELTDKNIYLGNLPYLTRVYGYTNHLGQQYAIYRVLNVQEFAALRAAAVHNNARRDVDGRVGAGGDSTPCGLAPSRPR